MFPAASVSCGLWRCRPAIRHDDDGTEDVFGPTPPGFRVRNVVVAVTLILNRILLSGDPKLWERGSVLRGLEHSVAYRVATRDGWSSAGSHGPGSHPVGHSLKTALRREQRPGDPEVIWKTVFSTRWIRPWLFRRCCHNACHAPLFHSHYGVVRRSGYWLGKRHLTLSPLVRPGSAPIRQVRTSAATIANNRLLHIPRKASAFGTTEAPTTLKPGARGLRQASWSQAC